MKRELFNRSYIEDLLSMKDLEEVVAALGKTGYREDIERGTVKHSGVLGIEEGLKDHLTTSINKIFKIVGDNKEASEMLKLLLGRWDVHNLHTVIRGKNAMASEEEIRSQLIPAGELDAVILNELVKQPDIKACIDLLSNWRVPYAKPMQEGFKRYFRSRNLADIELSVETFYYKFALENTERGLLRGASLNIRVVREFFKREIDFVNMMTAMRLVKQHLAEILIQAPDDGSADKRSIERPAISSARKAREASRLKIARYFIEGGSELDIEFLIDLAQLPEVEDLVEALRNTTYGRILDEGLKKYFETGSVTYMERLMEERIIRKTVSLFRGDPLSLSLLVAYVWAKYNEIVNLRIILQGKSVGMTEDRIREALVLV